MLQNCKKLERLKTCNNVSEKKVKNAASQSTETYAMDCSLHRAYTGYSSLPGKIISE